MAQQSTDPRAQYKMIANRSLAPSPAAFNEAVLVILAGAGITEPTPEQFVKGAMTVSFPCGRCAGTGQFITGVVDGKPPGPGGICYRGGGKGRQNDADRRRNYGYDNYAPIPGL